MGNWPGIKAYNINMGKLILQTPAGFAEWRVYIPAN